MPLIHLFVTGDKTKGFTLGFSEHLLDGAQFPDGELRTSPVFPVADANPANFLDSETLLLLVPKDTTEFINDLLKPEKDRAWFTLGLVSLIVTFSTAQEAKTFCLKNGGRLLAWELWRLDADRKIADIEFSSPEFSSVIVPSLTHVTSVSKDTRRLAEETFVNFKNLYSSISSYLPELVESLDAIAKAVNDLLMEVDELEAEPNVDSTPGADPVSQNSHVALNQCLSHLIQLNSGLAYVVSQTVYGSIPILDRPCLVASHSLFGIGTAYRGIAALSRYVEKVFETYPVWQVVDRYYRKTGVPGFRIRNRLSNHELDDWSDTSLGIDEFISEVTPQPTMPKLAFFSSRLGFGESSFCITCAIQVLHAADSIRWSPITLTHELLHSHVTCLLSIIMTSGGDTDADIWRAFGSVHSELGKSADQEFLVASSMLESIRACIGNFVVTYHDTLACLAELNDEGVETVQLDPRLPESANLFRSFYRSSIRLVEEIIVHTLDLFYFYAGDSRLFVKLLWDSWTTVPAVVEDLEKYLLRSIVAVASLEAGAVKERFIGAHALVLETIQILQSESPSNKFLVKAVQHLKDEHAVNRLRMLFRSAIAIADMAAKFFTCRSIQAAFSHGGDNNIIPSGVDGLSEYAIDFGKFLGARVKNPVAFLLSRLRNFSNSTDDEDYRSAWCLLALATSATT